MKGKDILIVAGAALAAYLLLRMVGAGNAQQPKYWVTEQGNTGFPDAARTGGGVWI